MTGPRRDEGGMVVIEQTVTMILTLVVVAWVMVVCLWTLAHGVANSAADQGARAGSRIGVDSATACEARAVQAFGNLFPGASPDVSCSESAGVVTAEVRLVLTGGVAPFQGTTITATGSAAKEVAPGAGGP